jgi:glycosyltransferase involved in cell wall biosynthesis
MKNLSVVLPVHNEAEGIEDYIKKINHLLTNTSLTFELLAIENGSTDQSLAILKKLAKKINNLHVHQSEKGWGNAVQKGIELAAGKYVCYVVSDGQIDPKVITGLYDQIQKGDYDMAKISRINRENIKRLLNSRAYNLLARIVFGLSTRDVNGTPKILLSSVAKALKLESHNIAIDLELLIKLKVNGLRWLEVPVESYARETGSSSTNIKSVLEMLRYMKYFYFQKHRWKDML